MRRGAEANICDLKDQFCYVYFGHAGVVRASWRCVKKGINEPKTEKIQREGTSKAHDQMSHSHTHCRRRGFAASVCVCMQALDETRCLIDGNRAHPELHDEKAEGALGAGEWSDHRGITRPGWRLIRAVITDSRTRHGGEGGVNIYRVLHSVSQLRTQVLRYVGIWRSGNLPTFCTSARPKIS